ncbi:MAG: 3'-5' exonuclease [Bdellovibrionota bacterium]
MNPTNPPKPVYPRIQFPGNIHLITNDQELGNIAKELNSAKELGFDTETRASFKVGEVYKVALLQLATETDAYLIRLHGITQFESIKKVFENKEILKVGVAIRDDLRLLQKLVPFTPENFIELQTVAKEKGLQNMGLRGMTEEVLQSSLSKKAKISNWEVKTLTPEMIIYAATDAWIGLKLYRKIINQ